MGKQRIKARQYGRDKSVVCGAGSTHVIKLGWKRPKKLKDKTIDLPCKLNGFLICRDTIDSANGNRLLIDFQVMQRLGFTNVNIDNAIKGDFKASSDFLPQQLQFVIMSRAEAVPGGGYDFPGLHAESYERYTDKGLECFGDGMNADRKMPDGSRRLIPCVPYGRGDATPDTYCEFSGPGGSCKLHYRLTVCLIYKDAKGQTRPLSPELGRQARYRLDSTSEYVSMQVLEELDGAAARVDGLIQGLTGTLTFQKKSRRTGKGSAIVGSVLFTIDEESIMAREREIRADYERQRQTLIENKREGIEFNPSSVLAIEGPVIDAEPEPVEAAVEPGAEPIEAETEDLAPSPEDAPPRDIAELSPALAQWAELTGMDTDEASAIVLRRLMVSVEPAAAEAAPDVNGVDWFVEAGISAKRRDARFDLMRSMCEALASSNDKNFVIGEILN